MYECGTTCSYILYMYECGAMYSYILYVYECGATCSYILYMYECGTTCSYILYMYECAVRFTKEETSVGINIDVWWASNSYVHGMPKLHGWLLLFSYQNCTLCCHWPILLDINMHTMLSIWTCTNHICNIHKGMKTHCIYKVVFGMVYIDSIRTRYRWRHSPIPVFQIHKCGDNSLWLETKSSS